MPARGSTSTARRCATGSDRRPGCSIRWSAAIRRHVFAAEKIHGDDTTVPVLAPGLGRTKTGRLWVYVRDDRPFCGDAPPAAAYFYSPDRGGEHPAAHMAAFTGLLQADGYAGFEALYDPARSKPGPITEVACWAHCRRKILRRVGSDEIAGRQGGARSDRRDLCDRGQGPRLPLPPSGSHIAQRPHRCSRRSSHGPKPPRAKLSAKSALAEAFRYTIKRRVALTRFVTDGRLEVDNNIAENAMRKIALGQKNYLFAGSDTRRRAGSSHLHPRRISEAQRHQPGGLSQGYADKDRRGASHQPDRRVDAVADAAQPPRRSRSRHDRQTFRPRGVPPSVASERGSQRDHGKNTGRRSRPQMPYRSSPCGDVRTSGRRGDWSSER